MIRRFSLYGFLKNQRYYEPFIILFFLDQGLSFTQIGLLIGFRELCINLTEIPSGAFADVFGRRRSMVLSFVSYILAFALFGLSDSYWQFFFAMFFFAIGEAFRTGTHKAMIFTWLRLQGRSEEKTEVYGYTRSWSQIGSAVSIVLATIFVLTTNNYTFVFYFSIVPYILGLLNLMTYPKELEGARKEGCGLRERAADFRESLWDSLKAKKLRRLIAESMAFEGVFKAVSDYLQPVLKNVVLLLPVLVAFDETRRAALIVGAVYLVLHLASAYASRKSHRVVKFAGGEEAGSRFLWKVVLVLYLALIPLLLLEWYYWAIAGFVGLYIVQNFWRPIQVSRFDAYASETQGATMLSVESQAKSVSTMLIAPLLGILVDFVLRHDLGGEFWPVSTVAAAFVILVLVMTKEVRSNHPAQS